MAIVSQTGNTHNQECYRYTRTTVFSHIFILYLSISLSKYPFLPLSSPTSSSSVFSHIFTTVFPFLALNTLRTQVTTTHDFLDVSMTVAPPLPSSLPKTSAQMVNDAITGCNDDSWSSTDMKYRSKVQIHEI